MLTLLSLLGRDERGQGLVEYALVILFVAVAAIAAMSTFGLTVSSQISNVSAQMPQ